MLNQLNTTTKRELDTRYLVMQGSKTVTGNPITITDAEAMNAESVVVELEPKQDLHGYNKPWAGGTGKNKLPLVLADIKSANNTSGTWNGNVYSVANGTVEILVDNADNVIGIKANGTFNNDVYFNINQPIITGTLRLTGCPSDGDFDTTYALYQFRPGVGAIANDSGGGADIDVQANDAILMVIRNGVSVSNAIFKPMVSTDMSATYDDFEPYSNICPITGYSEVNVECNSDTYTIDLDGTKYGGTLDVTEGEYSDECTLVSLDVSWSGTYDAYYYVYIGANYSEALISDAFEISTEYEVTQGHSKKNIVAYNSTTGNLMVYAPDYSDATEFRSAVSAYNIILKYKTPSSVSTTLTDIPLLESTNNISTDGTNIQLKYQPNNVIGECKKYTDEKCAKVLPKPPTSNGTYNLVCTVARGVPTLSWKSTT